MAAAFYDHLARTTLELQGYRRRHLRTSTGAVHVLEADGHGTLPPLVLIHGFSSSGVHFFPLLKKLRPRVRRLILPDMPAHGFSETPAAGASAGALRAGLIDALDAVLDGPAVLFGNSMGGAGAIQYALARPERVLGLLLCSPTGAPMSREELSQFVRGFLIPSHDDALGFIDRVTANPSRYRQLLAWGLRRKFNHRDMRALLTSLTPEDLLKPEDLRALKPPVRLVWGEAERILPASQLAFFEQHLPAHTRVVTPRHFGHAPFMDDPETLAEEILSFSGELPPASAEPRREATRAPATDRSQAPRRQGSRSARRDPQETAPGSSPR